MTDTREGEEVAQRLKYDREVERMRIALKEIVQLGGYGVRHDLGDAITIAQDALSTTTPPRLENRDDDHH